MACPTSKREHVTRDEALDHIKQLVWKNHAAGEDQRSAGLVSYPCDECGAWHVGHQHVPTCYHYDTAAVLDAMTDTVALPVPSRRRMPKSLRRKNTGALLALYQCLEEREPLLWFSWSDTLDLATVPHPGTFVGRSPAASMGDGLVRFALPASVAKLRWSDYLERNHPARVMRKAVEALGHPADWLATDQPVPVSAVRRIDAWYRGRWVDWGTLPDDYDAWLAAERR